MAVLGVRRAAAEEAPHGIPVTVSTDPRHGSSENVGASFAAASFSQCPEALGIGALGDVETCRRYAEVVRAEYVAVGIRMALEPTLDLATEPSAAPADSVRADGDLRHGRPVRV